MDTVFPTLYIGLTYTRLLHKSPHRQPRRDNASTRPHPRTNPQASPHVGYSLAPIQPRSCRLRDLRPRRHPVAARFTTRRHHIRLEHCSDDRTLLRRWRYVHRFPSLGLL